MVTFVNHGGNQLAVDHLSPTPMWAHRAVRSKASVPAGDTWSPAVLVSEARVCAGTLASKSLLAAAPAAIRN